MRSKSIRGYKTIDNALKVGLPDNVFMRRSVVIYSVKMVEYELNFLPSVLSLWSMWWFLLSSSTPNKTKYLVGIHEKTT